MAGRTRRIEKALDPDTIVPWLASAFTRRTSPHVVSGVGEDDCGVVRLGNTVAVLSTDFLNATPIAEQLGLGGERVLGRLVVAATLADLLGSGATPRALLVGVTVPHGYPERRFKKIMLGVREEADRWNVPVIAGDTKLAKARAVLTCGIGTVQSIKQLFLTNRAKAGDAILVSGFLGTCAAATCLVARHGKRVPRWAVAAITVPALPVRLSLALSKLEVARGGIDVSDGLAADLKRLGKASGVGAVIEVDKIPVDPRVIPVALQEKVPPWAFCLASGGDFQFIVTVPRKAVHSVEKLGFARIGTVTRKREFWITDSMQTFRRRVPDVGHKDRVGQEFRHEIQRIIRQVASGPEES